MPHCHSNSTDDEDVLLFISMDMLLADGGGDGPASRAASSSAHSQQQQQQSALEHHLVLQPPQQNGNANHNSSKPRGASALSQWLCCCQTHASTSHADIYAQDHWVISQPALKQPPELYYEKLEFGHAAQHHQHHSQQQQQPHHHKQQQQQQQQQPPQQQPSSHSASTNGSTRQQQQQLGPKDLPQEIDRRILVDYDVEQLIGQGSFSRVYRIVHRSSGQPYAMKVTRVTRNKKQSASGTRPGLDNELTILSRMNHSNVIRLYEVFRGNGRVAMITQLASGGELYELIVSRGRLTEPESARFIRQLLQGIAYLHSVGVTHRDLKPENILLNARNSDDAVLLISDFGLAYQSAVVAEEETVMTDTCGTPEYIAPEVLMRFPYNNKVDMWAVGVISYIALSGLMPFDDPNRTRLYRNIIRGQYYYYPEYWSSVSPIAREFVSVLLTTEPFDRPSSIEALCHPWLAGTSGTRPLMNGPHIPRRSYVAPMAPAMSDADSESMVSMATTHRTRSVRSVARSDHRKLDPTEIARLVDGDPEIKALVYDRLAKLAKRRWCRRPGTGAQSDFGAATTDSVLHSSSATAANKSAVGGGKTTTKHYGMV